MTATSVSPVTACASTGCAYNKESACSAFAVTIGGDDAATCTTFITIDARGGLPVGGGKVGACHHLECVHNTDLTCTAQNVSVGDNAECLSFEAR